MNPELNFENFQLRLQNQLDKGLKSFINSIHYGLTGNLFEPENDFVIYGLNISIYLKEAKTERYRIHSLYFSQEKTGYYEALWEEYLKEYNGKYSRFDDEKTKINGWFDHFDVVDKKDSDSFRIDQSIDSARFDGVITADITKEFNEENTLHVEDGWLSFIRNKGLKGELPFNLNWTSSFLHEAGEIIGGLDYPEWFVSSYLLIDIGNIDALELSGRNYTYIIRKAVNKLLFSASLSFHELLIAQKQENLKKQSERTAIIQILSRNFSHHIGSHVSIRSSSEQLKKIAKEHRNPRLGMERALELKDRLDKYEIERNEFVADPNPFLKGYSFFGELLKVFVENRLLMRFIAAGEQYTVRDGKNMFELRFLRNGSPLVISYGDYQYPEPFDELLSESILNQGVVKFVNGHGEIDDRVLAGHPHALYSILENIIRNTVKHNDRSGSEKLTIHINLEDDGAHLFRVVVWDNLTNMNDSSFTELQQRFRSTVLDQEGRPRRDNNGILDIKISANLLAGKDNFSFSEENDPIELTLLQEGNQARLCYSFLLKRHVEVGAIGLNDFNAELTFESIAEYREFYRIQKYAPEYLAIEKKGLGDLTPQILETSKWFPKRTDGVTSIEPKIAFYEWELRQYTPENPLILIVSKEGIGVDVIDNLLESQNVKIQVLFLEDLSSSHALLSKNFVWIDHHGEGATKACEEGFYFDPFKHNYQSFDKKLATIAEYVSSLNSTDFLREVLRAMVKKVLIIDERIAENLERIPDKKQGNIDDYLGNAAAENIFILSKLIIDNKSYLNCSDGFCAELRNEQWHFFTSGRDEQPKSENLGKFDYVVIHRSVFLIDQERLWSLLRKMANKVIITSGSGSLNGIEREVFFLPLTELRSCFDPIPDKLSLIRSLDTAELKLSS